jgi:ribulose kinase
MEPPKLLWLRRHLYDECWRKASYFFDLVDYLTYKSTDAPVRSLCSLVCKWCYVPPSVGDNKFTEGWDDSFWAQIGLEDLTVDGYIKLGENVQYPGSSISSGLSSKSASELGLVEGTPVASGLIDAHAGALGMLGADTSHISLLQNSSHLSRLALISGTSSCHMKLSDEPLFINGVWGPYSSVILPNMHLNEGGQSAAGSLVCYIKRNRMRSGVREWERRMVNVNL